MLASDQITLEFKIAATNIATPLGMRVCLNKTVIYENAQVDSEVLVQHQMEDTDGDHQLTFELFGKLPAHTEIDEQGNIISDSMLCVSDLRMDNIDINHLFQTSSVYHHDCNGSQPPADYVFYGSMGCNGTVTFKFSTPIYIWMLENM